MKKKLFKFVSMAALFTLASTGSAWAIPSASLNVLDSDIVVGETFNVEVWIDGDDNGAELLSFGFDVAPSLLSLISYADYTIESGFDDETPLSYVDVAGSSFPGVTDDDVLLATLSFLAGPVAGNDTLSIGGLYDSSGLSFAGLFYTDGSTDYSYDIFASLDITINSGTAPVPEPATMILFGTGLAGFFGSQLKRKIKK
jgi:hypothetical protein